FPRNKPCGGGISLRVLRRFPYLDRELPRIATHVISRLHLEGPAGESTVISAGRPAALMIRRVEFDALLVSLAVAAGADLISGADVVHAREDADRVTLTTRDGRRFHAPIVVAADGVHSIVARRLGLNPGWPASAVALDMMEESPRAVLRDVDPSTLWVAYGYDHQGRQADRLLHGEKPAGRPLGPGGIACPRRGTPEGYAYVFPKRDHVNIESATCSRITGRPSTRRPTMCSARSWRASANATLSSGSRRGRTSRHSSFRSAGPSASPDVAACWWRATRADSSTPLPPKASTTQAWRA